MNFNSTTVVKLSIKNGKWFSLFAQSITKVRASKKFEYFRNKNHKMTLHNRSMLIFVLVFEGFICWESFNFIPFCPKEKHQISKHTHTQSRPTHYGVVVIFTNMLCFLFLAPQSHTHTLTPSRSTCVIACVRPYLPLCLFPESAVKFMIWSVKFT